MDKALIIIPDNNKGRFITKGYAKAFNELSFFVIEKKIYDLNLTELKQLSPNIIFIFWSETMSGQQNISDCIENFQDENTVFIHCAEYLSDIPKSFKKKKNHHIFTADSKTKKNMYFPAILSKDYKTKFEGYRYNITFAGNPAKEGREKILAKLIYNFGSINIFCRSFDFYKSVEKIEKSELLNEYFLELYKQSYKGYVETIKDLAEIYASTKINIDLEDEPPKIINYRALEILASGGFLMSKYNKDIIKYLDEGKDFETFKTDAELTDKINFYMKNLNIAQMIALRGKQNAVSNFLYTDRLKKILKVIYGKDISSR